MKIDHSLFGSPAKVRFYMSEDDGGAGGGGDLGIMGAASDVLGTKEKVEGEKPPDFGSLGAPKKAPEPAEGGKPPTKEEKAASEAVSAGKPPSKPEPKPAKAATPAKKAEVKPPAAKPEEKKPDATKPPAKVEAKPKVDPAKAEEKPAELKIPDDDKDIDDLRPQDSAPTHVVKSFNEMKDRMKRERQTAREALKRAEAATKEAETFKASAGKLPEEVEKELAGLRKLGLIVNAENDPRFKAEFDAKADAAAEDLISILEKKYQLPEKIAAEIRQTAKDNKGDIEAWPRWDEMFRHIQSHMAKREIEGKLDAWRSVRSARQARLEELSSAREKYQEEMGHYSQRDRTAYANGVSAASTKFGETEWLIEKEADEGASEEEKKAIQDHNATAAQRREQWMDNVRDLFERDPAKATEIAFKAMEADMIRTDKDVLAEENATLQKRVEDLEARLEKRIAAGRLGRLGSPAAEAKPDKNDGDGKVGGDGASAIKDFFTKR